MAGNLRTLTDNTPTTRYASTSPLRNSWTYLYDGLSRLKNAQLTGAAATAFTYDGLGNMTTGNLLTFVYNDTVHPHHMSSLTPGGAAAYHEDGGLASRLDTDGAGADTAHTMSYDADGRVQTVTTGDGYTVRSVYDFRGERVARIINPGAGSQVTTFYYGRWFEVTGGTLTRHMYLGDRLIADSPVAAPSGLTLASISPEERSILLARAMRDTVRWSPQLYPGYVLTAEEAAKLGALLAFILVVLGATPGRVRVGLAVQRRSPFRRLRRGHVILVVTIFSLSLTPLTCVRSAHAGGSGGPPPPGTVFPVYFIHSDHLGSTVMLTCYKQGSCADRAVIRYFRYDAYGQMKAYDVNGTLMARGSELSERLYTGQRWDWQAQMYYYGARFYDPKVANFLSEDPVREYANPYAYVAWNPVKFSDPTGRNLWGTAVGFSSLGYNGFDSGKWAPYAAAQAQGGDAAVNTLFFGGGSTGSGGNAAATFVGPPQQAYAHALDASDIVRFNASHPGFSAIDARLTPAAFSFTAAALSPGSFAPRGLPGLVTALLNVPNNAVQWLIGFIAGGFQAPLELTSPFGGATAFLFGGNPGGYETAGSTIFGPDSIYDSFAQGDSFSFESEVGQTLAHEFGHIGQSAVLGPAYYPAWFAGAALAFNHPLTFNPLEKAFLGGAPTAPELYGL